MKLEAPHIDTLVALVEYGPLTNDQVPLPETLQDLERMGFLTKVVMKGKDDVNAATHLGRDAYINHFNATTLQEAKANRQYDLFMWRMRLITT